LIKRRRRKKKKMETIVQHDDLQAERKVTGAH
jgi:hypothetical protein